MLPRRAVLPLAAIAACLAAPGAAAAEATDVLRDPGARLFTVAGTTAKAVHPSDGVAATSRRLVAASLGALPSGELVFTDDRPGTVAKLWRVGVDGRFRELRGGRGAGTIAVEPGGTILAGVRDTLRVVRVSADGTTSTPVADLAGQPGADGELTAVATLPGGAVAAADSRHVWRIDPDGRVTNVAPGASNISAMTATTDGTILFFQGSDVFVYRIAPGGVTPARLTETRPGTTTLAPLPDGRVLLGVAGFLDDPSGTFSVLDPVTGARTVLGGEAPAFGSGDGGPLVGVAGSAGALTATPDGGLAFFQPDLSGNGVLRRLLPAGTPVPAATFDQAAYPAAGRSRTAVLATVAGAATVQVRSVATGKLLRTTRADVEAGTTTLPFTPALPATDLTQTLTFAPAAGGAPVVARATVSLRPSLKMAQVRTVLDERFRDSGGGDDEAGYGTERGTCRRRTAKRVDCVVLNYLETYRPYRKTTDCAGRVTLRQRPDGVRLQFGSGCTL